MLTIAQIMTRPVITVDLDASIEKIRRVFAEHEFHHVIVVERRRAVGVISDRDLLKHLSPFIGVKLHERSEDLNTLNLRAHQIMSRNIVTVSADDTAQRAIDLMLEHGFRCVPALDEDERPVGIVTWKDILRWGTVKGVWLGEDERPRILPLIEDDPDAQRAA